MGKHNISKRLSQSELKSIDYKARKRIEGLYLLTDEILNDYNHMNNKYDNKLYRKYKQLKELNRKLQEKLINQHCLGCKCLIQSNEENNQHKEKNSLLSQPSKNTIITNNKKKNSSIVSDVETSYNDSQINNEIIFENSSDDDDNDETSMDTEENVSKSITSNNETQEEVDENDGMSCLPSSLQAIIRTKVRKSKNDNKYLLKIGLYPALNKFLCDKSPSNFDRRPSIFHVRPFILDQVKHPSTNFSTINLHIRDELREIHRSYMLKFPNKSRDKEKITKKKATYQRLSI